MSHERGNTKALTGRKYRRRQWLTFVRMCRYGVNNFTRNAWLTIAATAVMTVTLVIIFMTLVARNVLNDSVTAISQKVDMSIYLKTETTDDQAQAIMADLRKLSNVRSVSYMSADEVRADNAEKHKTDVTILNAINQATNMLPGIIRVQRKDINDTSQLDAFVKTNSKIKVALDPSHPPSFAGTRREAIQNLARWTEFAQKVGLGASILFVAISSLIVFNTIRMAIFNRKEEIQMMKLIGANRSFIRGPFVVEAMVYGFIAAVFATGIGMGLLYYSRDKLITYGIAIGGTIDFLTTYIGLVLLAMIILGALVGTVSSMLATRRYLKV